MKVLQTGYNLPSRLRDGVTAARFHGAELKRNKKLSVFAEDVIAALRAVPRGRVASYGQVAWVAGHPGAARQVAWILHSSSRKHKLPWHRIIGANGKISLKRGRGFEAQALLLKKEGVRVAPDGRIDLKRHAWEPGRTRPGGGCFPGGSVL